MMPPGALVAEDQGPRSPSPRRRGSLRHPREGLGRAGWLMGSLAPRGRVGVRGNPLPGRSRRRRIGSSPSLPYSPRRNVHKPLGAPPRALGAQCQRPARRLPRRRRASTEGAVPLLPRALGRVVESGPSVVVAVGRGLGRPERLGSSQWAVPGRNPSRIDCRPGSGCCIGGRWSWCPRGGVARNRNRGPQGEVEGAGQTAP